MKRETIINILSDALENMELAYKRSNSGYTSPGLLNYSTGKINTLITILKDHTIDID